MQLPSRVLEVELTLVSSNHHVEMNPSDVGNNDKYVVQEILKVNHSQLYILVKMPVSVRYSWRSCVTSMSL